MRELLKSCVMIEAEGRQLYRFINAAHSRGLRCTGQYISSGRLCGEISRRDLEGFRTLAEEFGIVLRYSERPTLSAWLRRRRKRTGLIAGALMAAAAVYCCFSVITVIEIEGNRRISDGTILAALDEAGVRRGASIRGIDFVHCENLLQLNVDGISWVGIYRTVSRIVVEVTERVEKPDMVLDRIPCNVVAAHSAELTSVSVLSGQQLCRAGDYVPEGSLLISGVVTDEEGHTSLYHAMGSITGTYREEVTFTVPEDSEEWLPTGRSSVRRSLRLFGLEIPLSAAHEDFSSFTSETGEDMLTLSGRALPVGIITERRRETALTARRYTPEEQQDILMQKIFIYEKNFLSGDTEIIRREIPEAEGDTVTVRYTLSGEIGQPREILAK